MLYYEDGAVQHAGVVLGVGGVASHIFKRHPAESTGYEFRMAPAQNLSAVTAACLFTRREVWDQVEWRSMKALASPTTTSISAYV